MFMTRISALSSSPGMSMTICPLSLGSRSPSGTGSGAPSRIISISLRLIPSTSRPLCLSLTILFAVSKRRTEIDIDFDREIRCPRRRYAHDLSDHCYDFFSVAFGYNVVKLVVLLERRGDSNHVLDLQHVFHHQNPRERLHHVLCNLAAPQGAHFASKVIHPSGVLLVLDMAQVVVHECHTVRQDDAVLSKRDRTDLHAPTT